MVLICLLKQVIANQRTDQVRLECALNLHSSCSFPAFAFLAHHFFACLTYCFTYLLRSPPLDGSSSITRGTGEVAPRIFMSGGGLNRYLIGFKTIQVVPPRRLQQKFFHDHLDTYPRQLHPKFLTWYLRQ